MRQSFNFNHFEKSQAADLVRIVLLAKHGGIYSDSDVILIRRFPDAENFLSRLPDKGHLSNSVMKFLSRQPVLDYAIDAMKKSLSTADYFAVLEKLREAVEEYNQKVCSDNCNLKNVTKVDLICCNVVFLGMIRLF